MFGNYLDPDVQRLGDLDLAVTLRSRIPDTTAPADEGQIQLSYAKASGRPIDNLFDALSWPDNWARSLVLPPGSSPVHACSF